MNLVRAEIGLSHFHSETFFVLHPSRLRKHESQDGESGIA